MKAWLPGIDVALGQGIRGLGNFVARLLRAGRRASANLYVPELPTAGRK